MSYTVFKNQSSYSIHSDNLLRRSRVSSRIISQEELSKMINMTELITARSVITINIIINSANGGSFLRSIKLNISETDSVEKVIKHSIKLFNALFEREKLGLKLLETPSLYKLKPSKKNGWPKDLPGKYCL